MKHSNYRLTDRGSDSFPRYQIDAIVTHPDNTDRAAFEFIAFVNDNTLAKFIVANLERGFPYGIAAAPAAAEPLREHEPLGDECAVDGCPYEQHNGSRYCEKHKKVVAS